MKTALPTALLPPLLSTLLRPLLPALPPPLPSAWLSLLLPALRCLILLLITACALPARAAPPVLSIASEPLTAACRPPQPQTAGSKQLDGTSLLLPPTSPQRSGLWLQASMNAADWGGYLTRYLPPPGAAGMLATPAIAWEASAILTGDPITGRAPVPAPAARKLYTAQAGAGGGLTMVPFTWPALDAAQRAALDQDGAGQHDGLGEQRLAFLRGDRSREGRGFRLRSSVLGNAVHSTPVYVGQPSRADAPARPDMIYLGANDGMLHAFDAASGSEVFAYIPAAVFPALPLLTEPAYVRRAYIDGPALSGEALIAGQTRTVLLSAMGGGAQGVFALDVSDPLHFGEGSAEQGGLLWEFTDRDDPAMGNVTTLPQLARVRMGMVGGAPAYRHFAVVSSGLNNYAADGHASASGDGALFLLALDKPRTAPWQRDENYYRLSTPLADASLPNALSSAAIVADRNGIASYAYAGDLQGNLWRFDLRDGPPWRDAVGPGVDATPLFVARDAHGKRQPITQQPRIAFADAGGYLVLFGTGQLIGQADRQPSAYASQSFYAIHDSLREPAEVVTSRRQLARRVVHHVPASEGTAGTAGAGSYVIDGEAMTPEHRGWYVDLPDAATTGERSIDSAVVQQGALIFNTMLPATDPCAPARSRTYVLNVLTGLPDGLSVTARLPAASAVPQPVVAELSLSYAVRPLLLPVASTPSPRDAMGRLRVEKTWALVAPGSLGADGMAAGQLLGKVTTSVRAGRLSWREVANWRQLHEAAR